MEIEDKDKLSYLTNDQKVYLELIRRMLPLHGDDMARTLIYLQKHAYMIKPFEREATRQLTARQKNQVLCELLLPY